MWGRGHEKEMISHLGKLLPNLVGQGLVVIGGCTHFVSLINDDQIPAIRFQETLLCTLDAGDPRERGHHLILLVPWIRTIRCPENLSPDNMEVLPELLLHFPLPLEGKVRRGDDENPFS